MEDSIKRNLDFKFLIFITLLGAWWWMLRYAALIDQGSPRYVLALCLLVTSFFLFYPLVRSGLMMIYSSMYQVAADEEKKNILNEMYNKHAKAFFEWWPLAIALIPIFFLIPFFKQPYNRYLLTGSILYFTIIILYFLKKKIYSPDDLKRQYWVILWFFAYTFIVSAIYGFLKVLG